MVFKFCYVFWLIPIVLLSRNGVLPNLGEKLFAKISACFQNIVHFLTYFMLKYCFRHWFDICNRSMIFYLTILLFLNTSWFYFMLGHINCAFFKLLSWRTYGTISKERAKLFLTSHFKIIRSPKAKT